MGTRRRHRLLYVARTVDSASRCYRCAVQPYRATVARAAVPTFVAPTDVKLSESDVVQPDILAVCDQRKITDTHIDGAPDLIVEVLSPGTAARDLRQKKSLYARCRVPEYLVVDPLEHYAIRFLLGPEGYDVGTVFAHDEILAFVTLEAVAVPLWEVFGVAGPDGAAPMMSLD